MKYVLLIILFVILSFRFGAYAPVGAFYDPRTLPNNKVGIHLLDPSEVSVAKELVNNNGGDWGYVTVPIQPSDRDQIKWQTFMHNCRDLHLIPIIRITTIPFGGTWETAQDTDLVDFANFLGELDWPVENRYIVLFNEVNRDQEWGGTVSPSSYTKIVKNAYTIFKERSKDFFLLGPALDSALPNSNSSMSAANYLLAMQKEDPTVWSYFDGWASHSYPNPGFSAAPTKTGWTSIVSYKTEINSLRLADKPVFITETGWDQQKVSAGNINAYWQAAFTKWNADNNVVAVTPFVLQGGAQFKPLSLYSESGSLNPSGTAISNLSKTRGEPKLSSGSTPLNFGNNQDHLTSGDNRLTFIPSSVMLQIENLVRTLVGLPSKRSLTVGSTNLIVEEAKTPKQWEKGLSGRDNLVEGTGMLFIFPREHIPLFWMKEMKFPLDLVWINGSQIIAVTANVPVPTGTDLPTYSPPSPVDKVLEVPAGYAAAHGWTAGTELSYD